MVLSCRFTDMVRDFTVNKRLCSENQNPFRSRLLSWIALGFCAFALVALPALHGHIHHLLVETSSEHSNSGLPVPDKLCPICKFVRTAVSFCVIAESLLLHAGIESKSLLQS